MVAPKNVVPKIYPFLVIDPDYRDEYALVREEQWRAWADKAEEDHADFNNGPCETGGLLKLNLYVAYVGFIHLALHRERAYLRNTDSVGESVSYTHLTLPTKRIV